MLNPNRNLIIRRNGTVIRSRVAQQPKRSKAVHQHTSLRNSYTKFNMSLTEQREHTPMPTRKDLTKAQYREYCEGLKILKSNNYLNPDYLSLNELRETLYSIKRCCDLRAKYAIQQ